MSKLILQNIVDDIPFDILPVIWQDFDLKKFSKDKTLFDFQKKALENALKALWLYFKDKKENKTDLFNQYCANGLEEKFDYNLKKKREGKTAKYLLEYGKDYPAEDDKISFAHFINRMSFWMATGSGKTLVIVKLIEFLGRLIADKELPERDILYLAHRSDLLDQFKNHVKEFNSSDFGAKIKINLKNLRDYESVKRENALPFAKNEITVFYYRSDLISDIQKEKIVNFRNYDNSGKWHILLDEAHKGDKEDSKRQILYSILSRNGFLFNFSATFTDPKDFITCVFDFNLSKFVGEGYGKHIYVSSTGIDAFRNKNDFSKTEKQKIVLKALVLLTYIHKYFEKIKKYKKNLYHRPLLLTLVNSVNKPDADLQLFFREIENIAREKPRLFDDVKKDIICEFQECSEYEIEEGLEFVFNEKEFEKIKYEDVLKHVFGSKKPGSIEISFRPSDKSQVAFKLVTSDRYFALIKTGEMPQWLKNELGRFNINHRFETEGFFQTINNNDSDINILMGSRSFYEGWDSNRPNLILFVNIGIGKDAKKFVLQSVGRGVRIEPVKNKRKRFRELLNAKEVKEELYEKIKNLILPIESLFVFGTNAENLKEIIATLRAEAQDRSLGELFVLNPEAQKHLLLVPVYKTAERIFAEEKDPQKYPVSRDDFETTSQFYEFLGDRVAVAKYDCEVKVLKKTKESFAKKEKYYDFGEKNSLFEPELILDRIFDYLGVKSKEFEKFKELENEIVHFKKVRFNDGEKYEEIRKKIEEVRHYPERQKELDKQYGKIPRKEFERQMALFEQAGSFEMKNQKIKIKHLANHYYLPVIVSETEKIDYLNHIINVNSEVKFIEQLEEYLARPDNVFAQFDWWMFSKLDQTLDEVLIPYYDPNRNRIANFKPDFIFWAQKGKRYLILLIDPKGTEHANGYRKIDGYSRIFETGEQKESRDFSYNGFTVNVKLLLKPAKGGIASVPEPQRRYWFDNFVDFADKISWQEKD